MLDLSWQAPLLAQIQRQILWLDVASVSHLSSVFRIAMFLSRIVILL